MQQFFDLGFCLHPFCGQRPDDDRLNNHHDLLGIGVMCTDLAAFLWVEKAFEQRSKDRWIDLAPVEAGSSDEQTDVARIERQGTATIEQTTVEMRDFS